MTVITPLIAVGDAVAVGRLAFDSRRFSLKATLHETVTELLFELLL